MFYCRGMTFHVQVHVLDVFFHLACKKRLNKLPMALVLFVFYQVTYNIMCE